jgi:hypothetical protein
MAEENPNTILSEDPNGGTGPGTTGEPSVTGGDNPPQPTPQAETFDFAKMVGAEGALAENWRDGLPESIRGEKCLDSIKTIGTLAQSYVHAQKSMGANKVTIPGENATPEEIDAFHKALGRPDKMEDYATDKVELPKGIVLDDAEVGKFREFAFKQGLSQAAFEAALKFDVERVKSHIAAQTAAANAEYEETKAKLLQEFGDKADSVVAQCNQAMRTFGLVEVLRDHGLLSNYTVIKALAKIGGSIGESKLKGDGGTPAEGDPETRLAEIRNNPDDPLYKKDHPAHNARVAEVDRLCAAIAKQKQGKN